MKLSIRKIFLAVLTLSSLFLIGCGAIGDSTDSKKDTVEKEKDAWSEFDNANYNQAASDFKSILDDDADAPSSYCGLGWSYARIDSFDTGIKHFQDGIKKNDEDYCSHIGYAFTSAAINKHTDGTGSLNTVLEAIDEAFIVTDNFKFEIVQLRTLLAIASFMADNTPALASQAKLINSNLNISEGDPGTWKSGNTKFNSYKEALLYSVLN